VNKNGGSSKAAKGLAMMALLVISSAACSASRTPDPSSSSSAGSAALHVADEEVRRILLGSCYPCHANERDDPWYAHLAPSSWSGRGRAALNFDEWQRYDPSKRSAEMTAIAVAVQDGYMPLKDYTFFNWAAKLDEGRRQRIIQWAKAQAQPAH
jgi:Haem-binding domain